VKSLGRGLDLCKVLRQALVLGLDWPVLACTGLARLPVRDGEVGGELLLGHRVLGEAVEGQHGVLLVEGGAEGGGLGWCGRGAGKLDPLEPVGRGWGLSGLGGDGAHYVGRRLHPGNLPWRRGGRGTLGGEDRLLGGRSQLWRLLGNN